MSDEYCQVSEGDAAPLEVWRCHPAFPSLLTAALVPALGKPGQCRVTSELGEVYPSLDCWVEGERVPMEVSVILTTLGGEEFVRRYPAAVAPGRSVLFQEVTLPPGMRMVEAAEVMTRVRREGKWEQQQTHVSLLPFLWEETGELAEAIESGVPTRELVAELGDVFLEVLFHAAIGESMTGEQHFSYDDMAGALLDKLAGRMPYAFDGGPFPATVEEQDRLWQEAKRREKRQQPEA